MADCFLDFDRISLSVCQTAFKYVLTGRLNADNPHATSSLEEIAAAQEELTFIYNGRLQFHKDFLKNQPLIEYTGKSLSILSQMLRDPYMNEPVRRTFDSMVFRISPVPDKIIEATRRGSLDSEMRVALRRRWKKVNEMSDFMDGKGLLVSDKMVPSW